MYYPGHVLPAPISSNPVPGQPAPQELTTQFVTQYQPPRPRRVGNQPTPPSHESYIPSSSGTAEIASLYTPLHPTSSAAAAVTPAMAEHEAEAPGQAANPEDLRDLVVESVYVAFCKSANSRAGGWRGLLKSCIIKRQGGPNHHSELVFVFSKRDDPKFHLILSCTVLRETGVRFNIRSIDKRYVSDYWTTFQLDLTAEQRNLVYQFCSYQNGKPFNFRGFYFHFIPCCFGACCGMADLPMELRYAEPSWFCSQLDLAALQYACPEFRQDDRNRPILPSQTTPEAFLRLLELRNKRLHYIQTMYDTREIMANGHVVL
jgi:hypothetical protein